MSEFSSMREEIMSIKSDLNNMITNLTQYSAEERQAKMVRIEQRFGEINQAISEMESQMMMFEGTDKNEAKVFTNQIKADVKRLENQYIDAKKRGSERDQLFGNAAIRADGSSAGQMNSLYDQRQQIDEGNSLTDELGRSVNAGKEAGVGILAELGNQRNTIDHVDDELNKLDTDVDTGSNLIDRMTSRQNRRKVFMVILIIVLVIAICVFLYFVFRP